LDHAEQVAIGSGDDRGVHPAAAEPLGQLGQRTVRPNRRRTGEAPRDVVYEGDHDQRAVRP
jgi:hypothetical protein